MDAGVLARVRGETAAPLREATGRGYFCQSWA
jgi:hypothetical protein